MTLKFLSKNPAKLSNDIIAFIEKGAAQTWSLNNKYLNHNGQWSNKGFIELKVNYLNSPSVDVYVRKHPGIKDNISDFEGYYLGRFCELMFVNFSNGFSTIVKVDFKRNLTDI